MQKPEQPPEIAYHGALILVALLIVAVLVFLAALVRGNVVLLLPLLWGVWRLARRWPDMKLPLVFAFGLLGVLVGAGEVIIQVEIHHVGSGPVDIGVLVATLLAIVMLLRWALRRMSAREAAAGASETREKETTTGTSEK